MKIIVTLHRQKEQEVLTRHSVNRLFSVSSNIYSFRFLVIGKKKV